MDLVALQHVESSKSRDRIHVPCVGRWILNHWTNRDVLARYIFKQSEYFIRPQYEHMCPASWSEADLCLYLHDPKVNLAVWELKEVTGSLEMRTFVRGKGRLAGFFSPSRSKSFSVCFSEDLLFSKWMLKMWARLAVRKFQVINRLPFLFLNRLPYDSHGQFYVCCASLRADFFSEIKY